MLPVRMWIWRHRGTFFVTAFLCFTAYTMFTYDGTNRSQLYYANARRSSSPFDEEDLAHHNKYVFSLTTTKWRSKFICSVVESLWTQSIPPDQILIFHGSEVSLPSCPSPPISATAYTSIIVPDTGPAIKLRHLLLPDENDHNNYYYNHTVKYDVIVVDDDSIIHPDLARTLLRQRDRYPDRVIINSPISNYEHPRQVLWGAAGYLVPASALEKVRWQDNPQCYYDDDIWMGHLVARSGVGAVAVPGVDHGDIWLLQFEKWVFGRALSRSVNQNGSYRSECTRSLSQYP